MVKFNKDESADNDIAKLEDVAEADSTRKPSWVNLTQLEGAANDSMLNNLIFKPALRFHGLTGGFWGQNGAPSIATDSKPPSYRFSVSGNSTKFNEPCSTCDQGSVYDPNVSALSPLTLRRRNTIAVVLIAIALLATIAAITGIVLYLKQPKEMLRANVYFTIANRNFTEDMLNRSSVDFKSISNPLCAEMDLYFLSSELAEHYLRCDVVSLKKNETKPGLAVHFTLDFDENKATNDGDRIRNIILKKSGRLEADDNIYLVIRKFLVYLKSLRIELEVKPKPDDKTGYRPRIPWREDVDFIARKSDILLEASPSVITKPLPNQIFTPVFKVSNVPMTILADANTRIDNGLYPSTYYPSVVKTVQALHEPAFSVLDVSVMEHSVFVPKAEFAQEQVNKWRIIPTKTPKFDEREANSISLYNKHNLNMHHNALKPPIAGFQSPDSIFKPELLPLEILENDFEVKNLVLDRNEIKHLHNEPNRIVNPNTAGKNINNNHLEGTYSSSLQNDNNDKRNNKYVGTGNPEKVLTLFTDVFLILGRDAQVNANMKKLLVAETGLILPDSSFPKELLHSSEVILPKTSVRYSLDDQLIPTFVSSSILTSSTISVSTPALSEDSLLDPEIEPSDIKIETKTAKFDVGKKLEPTPDVIIIHTTRSETPSKRTFLMKNVPPDKERGDKHLKPALPKKKKIRQISETRKDVIKDQPKLLEMQEVTYPPVPTNQTSGIRWFNVLNVSPRGIETIMPNLLLPLPIRSSNTNKPILNIGKHASKITRNDQLKSNVSVITNRGFRESADVSNTLNILKGKNMFIKRKSWPINRVINGGKSNAESIDVMQNIIPNMNKLTPNKRHINNKDRERTTIETDIWFQNILPKNNFASKKTFQPSNKIVHIADQTQNRERLGQHILHKDEPIKIAVAQSNIPTKNNAEHSSSPFNNFVQHNIRQQSGISKPHTNKVDKFINILSIPESIETSSHYIDTTVKDNSASKDIQQTHKDHPSNTFFTERVISYPEESNNVYEKSNPGSSENRRYEIIERVTGYPVSIAGHKSKERTKQVISKVKARLPSRNIKIVTRPAQRIQSVNDKTINFQFVSQNQRNSIVPLNSGTNKSRWNISRNTFQNNQPWSFLLQKGINPVESTGVGAEDKETVRNPVQNRDVVPPMIKKTQGVYNISDKRVNFDSNVVSHDQMRNKIPSHSGVTKRRWNTTTIKSQYVQPWLFRLQNDIISAGRTTGNTVYETVKRNPINNRYIYQSSYMINAYNEKRRTLQTISSSGRHINSNRNRLRSYFNQRYTEKSTGYGQYNNLNQRRIRIPNNYMQFPYSYQRQLGQPSRNRQFQYLYQRQLGKPNNNRPLPYSYQKQLGKPTNYRQFPYSYQRQLGKPSNYKEFPYSNQRHLGKPNNYRQFPYPYQKRSEKPYNYGQLPYYYQRQIRKPGVFNNMPGSITTKLIEDSTYPFYRNIQPYRKYRATTIKYYDSLPAYPNFTDIIEMKKVLQQLVESLFDMTNKINKMQNAIDYINNTFHERNESLKSVADTLSAMTSSLNNFNSNLNDINTTLNGFKDFLKYLNNSMFNINDVIKYLDDSVFYLDATVNHLDESVKDMNATLSGITDRTDDVDNSLKMINRTVIDVRDTTLSTNITLDSMNKTLQKLSDIISNFGTKLNEAMYGLHGINVSLKSINDTVQNSYARLGKLGKKIDFMNDTIQNINVTMTRLNNIYLRINEALHRMNESFDFSSGTLLEELTDLTILNQTLKNVSTNVDSIDKSKNSMNHSLTGALQWIKSMMDVLNSLNISIKRQNDTILISLEDKELLETLNSLLSKNGSLSSTSREVDDINDNLTGMEENVIKLEDNLMHIEQSLDSMNITLMSLNQLLKKVNRTIKDISEPLNSVDDTLEKLKQNSNDIDESIRNVNLTLISANKSINSIDSFASSALGSVERINETIVNAQLNSELLAESVDGFILDLEHLSGSLPELNTKVLNDKETLNIIKEEASILNNSMEIVENKIGFLQTAYETMALELNKTAKVLDSSELNLSDIQIDISDINETLTLLMQNLADIEGPLVELNNSFMNISSSFPSIQMRIQSGIERTNKLKSSSKNLSRRLQQSHSDVNESVSTSMALNNDILLLKNTMQSLGKALNGIKLNKLNTDVSMDQLLSLLQRSEEKLHENVRKIKLMNSSFEPLFSRYIKMNEISDEISTDFKKSENSLETVEKRLVAMVDTLVKYPKINISLMEDLEQLKKAQQRLNHSNFLFHESTVTLKSKNNSLWKDDGNPVIQNVSFEVLQETVNDLNVTLNEHDKSLKQIFSSLLLTNELSNSLNTKLDKISKTARNLDNMKEKTTLIDNTLSSLEETFDEQSKQISLMIDAFNGLLSDLSKVEAQYGNVNGSDNETIYSDIRNLLFNSLRALNSQMELSEKNILRLSNITEKYNDRKVTFYSKDFGIDEESNSYLNQLIDNLDNTLVMIKDLNESSTKINSTIGSIESTLKETENDILSLEKSLNAELLKNKYIISKSKDLEQDFEKLSLDIKRIQTIVQQHNITSTRLLKVIDSLQLAADKVDIINFIFVNETHILNRAKNKLQNIVRQLQKISSAITDEYEEFKNFDAENASIEQVKSQYYDYVNKLKAFDADLDDFEEETMLMNLDFVSVDDSLKNTSQSLNLFVSTSSYLNQTNSFLGNVNRDIRVARKNLNSALNKTKNVKSDFQEMEKIYANVSSEVLKTSASYIQDLLFKKQEKLNKSMNYLNNISDTYEKVYAVFKDLKNTFWSNTYTRNNILSNLLRTNATLDKIQSKASLAADALARLNIDLLNINVSLNDMDDILHERNTELFLKRQKRFFVSENLPDLLDLYSKVNTSLYNAWRDNALMTENVQSLLDMKTLLKTLQNESENLNIPLIKTEIELSSVQNYSLEIQPSLLELRQKIDQINISLVLDGAEDIFDTLSIEGVNKIFDETVGLLNNVSAVLDRTHIDTEINKEKLDGQHSFLSNLKDLFKELNTLEDKYAKNKDQWGVLKKSRLDINENIETTETELQQSFRHFHHLENVFQELDTHILNSTLLKSKNSLENIDKSISYLLEKEMSVSRLEAETQKFMGYIANNLSEKIRSEPALERVIKDIQSDHNATTINLNQIANNHNRTNKTLQTLEGALLKLKKELDSAEKELKILRKRDYVEQNLPLLQEVQTFLENKIKNTSDSLSNLAILHNSVSTIHNSTKSLIKSQSKYDISVKDDEIVLHEVKELLLNKSDLLQNIINQTHKLIIDLQEDKLYKNLNNSSLDDIRKQFNHVNRHFLQFQNTLDDIDNTSHIMLDELNSVQNSSKNIIDRIGEMTSLIAHTEEVIPKWEEISDKLSEQLRSFDNLKSVLNKVKYNLDEMNHSYSHVRDKLLRKRLEDAQQNIQQLYQDANQVAEILEELDENNTITDQDVTKVNSLKFAKVTTLNQLDRDRDNMMDLAEAIERSTIDLNNHLNDSNLNAEMLSMNILNLHKITNELKRDLAVAENLEYLENVLPVLEKKHDDAEKYFLKTNETLQKTTDYLQNATKLLLSLKNRLNLTDKVDIEITNFDDINSRARASLNMSLLKLETDYQDLVAMNIDGIRNNSSLIKDTVSLSSLKSFLSNINNSMNSILDSMNNTENNVKGIHGDIETNTAAVLDVLNSLDTISGLENETRNAGNTLLQLQGQIDNTNNDVEHMAASLQHLNASLNNMIANIHDINNSALVDEIRYYKAKLNTETENIDILRNLLIGEKSVLVDAYSDLTNLNSVLDNVSESIPRMKVKIKIGSDLLKEVKAKQSRIEEALPNISRTIPGASLDIAELERELKTLEETFDQQQIKDYIQNHLPDLWKAYDAVNSSLHTKEKQFLELESNIYELQNKTIRIENKIMEYSPLNISLESFWNKSNHMAQSMDAIRKTYTKLFDSLNEIGRSLVNYTANNETIDELKEQFSLTRKKILDLNEELNVLATPLENMNQSLKAYDTNLSAYSSSIKLFENMKEHQATLNASYDRFHKLREKVSEKLKNNSDKIDFLFNNILDMQWNFSEIDDDLLHYKRDIIQQNIMNENQTFLLLENTFNQIDRNISEQFQVSKKIESLLQQNVESFDNLDGNLQVITELTQNLLENIPETAFAYSAIDEKINNQTHFLSQIEKRSRSLADSFRIKEKENFVNATLPLMNQLHESLSENIKETEDTILAAYDNALDAESMFESIIGLLSDEPLLNISTQNMASELRNIKSNLQNSTASHAKINNTFENFNVSILFLKDFSSVPISELRNEYFALNKSFSDMKTSLSSIDQFVGETIEKSNLFKKLLNDSSNAIQNYKHQVANASFIDKEVASLTKEVDNSQHLLSSVGNRVQEQKNELEDILSMSVPLSDSLKHKIADFRNKTNAISRRLALVQDLFKEKLIQPGERNNALLVEATDLLNSIFTSFENLENTTELVNTLFMNVSAEATLMKKEIKDFINEGNQMVERLKQSNKTLIQIKKLLKLEKKDKFLDETFPQYFQRYTELNISLSEAFRVLNLSNESLYSLTGEVENTNRKTDSLSSINTLTSPFMMVIEPLKAKLDTLYHDIKTAADAYNSFNISELNDKKLVFNDEITIAHLQNIYNRYNHSVEKLDDTVQTVLDSNSLLIPKLIKLEGDIQQLNDMLLSFTESEKQLMTISKELRDAFNNKSEISDLVNKVDNELQSLNNSLHWLKTTFKGFIVDTNQEETTISDTKFQLENLKNRLSDATISLTDIKKDLEDMHSTFYIAINDTTQLDHTITDVNAKLPHIDKRVQTTKKLLAGIQNDIPAIEIDLSILREDLKSMELMLSSQQNKTNFVRSTKPYIEQKVVSTLEALERTYVALENARQKGHTLEDSVTALKQKQSVIPSIELKFNNTDANISHIMNKLQMLQRKYDDFKSATQIVTNEITSYNVLDVNKSVSDVENQYEVFNKTLENILFALDSITDEAMSYEPKLSDMISSITKIDRGLDEFRKQEAEVHKSEEKLNNVSVSLNNSHIHINKLRSYLEKINDTFLFLQEQYSDVMQTELANKTKVALQLKGVKDYVKEATKRIHEFEEMFTTALSSLMVINGTLYQDIDTYQTLNRTIEKVLLQNSEFRKYLKDMLDEIRRQDNDTNFFRVSLNELPVTIDDLRQSLDMEQKRKYINESFPKFETQYELINISMNSTFEKLKSSEEMLKFLENKFQLMKSNIQSIANIRISTDPYQKKIDNFNETLEILISDTVGSLNGLTGLNASSLKNKSIIGNEDITLKVLKQTYNKSQTLLDKIEKNLNSIEAKNGILVENMTAASGDQRRILQLLESYNDVNDTVMLVSSKVNDANNNKTQALLLLQSVENELTAINTSLWSVKQNYSEFKYNSSSEQHIIASLDDNIMKLKDRLKAAAMQLLYAESMHENNQHEFKQVIDSPENLNDIISQAKDLTMKTKKALKNFTLSLEDILANIPIINLNISTLHSSVKDMGQLLLNQKNKADFVREAKPVLQKRLENTTTAFQSTNLSLELMRQQIQDLQNYVDSVNQRLDALPTVNISLTDIDKNLTEMENRLIIMQDYYNNVQEVLKHLDGNIDSFNILDKNLTVNHVENRYSMFNKTLDDVNAVLGKIGREFDSFGFQFSHMNNTLGNVDDAISRFEEKTLKIKVLEEDIHNFGSSLNETDKHINDMISVARRLNESFWSLKENYTDVINKTAEKNSNIEQKIVDIDKYLKGAKRSINNVAKLYFASQSNFTMINQSLFKDIYTYEDLNTTLSDVKQAYSVIRSQLKGMQHIIANKSTETNKFNSTLVGVSAILDELKIILNDAKKDQAKVNYINAHMDKLKSQVTSLQQPLKESISSIAMQDEKLGDVQKLAKSTGQRLNKFRTLDISIDSELKRTKNLKSVLKELNHNISDTNKTISKIKDLMKSLEDRSIPLEDIKSKFESVNSTIHDLKSAFANIGDRLASTKNETALTNDALLKLQSTMDTFKAVQKQVAKIRKVMKQLNSKSSESSTDLASAKGVLDKVETTIKAMDLMQTILVDSDFEAFKPKVVSNLTNLDENYKALNISSQDIDTKIEKAHILLEDLVKTVQKILTKDNIDQGMEKLQDQLKTTARAIKDLETPIKTTHEKSKSLLSGVKLFDNHVEIMKDKLAGELEKYEYVKDNLPGLQNKYVTVKESLLKNNAPFENIKNKLVHMKEVTFKIKEKMKLFGVEDTDGSVQLWDKKVMDIETYIKRVTEQNGDYKNTLDILKTELWKEIKQMYTKNDSLESIKSKFDNYNKSLDGIDTSLQHILLELEELEVSANQVSQDLVDRNTILTTTPPTTTPSGIPDWLTFNSSGGSVIDRDSATLKCNVDDLTLWEMMKIEKEEEDGSKVVLAAWKLGVGARKTIRDRRIKVTKIEDGVSGSLIVTIDRLRCEDEAIYYCTIDTYRMWPVETAIHVTSLPEDSLTPNFPTEVFEDKTATFSCTGYPGYPDGQITWRIKHENDTDFHDFDFYSQISNVSEDNCRLKENNNVPFQFDMSWNNTKVRCYIENTDYYAEGEIRLLPYDLCNNVRYLGTIGHPYTPHKYIVCGKELNIMQCPGNTCYDVAEHNCVQCKADHRKGDPCLGQPLYSYVAHETDCKKYYICMGPTKSTKKCTRGYFSPRVPGYCVLAYSLSECARRRT